MTGNKFIEGSFLQDMENLKKGKELPDRTAYIKITPIGKTMFDVKTNNVSNLELLDAIHFMQKHYAKLVVDEYVKATGDNAMDDQKLTEWMEAKREKEGSFKNAEKS